MNKLVKNIKRKMRIARLRVIKLSHVFIVKNEDATVSDFVETNTNSNSDYEVEKEDDGWKVVDIESLSTETESFFSEEESFSQRIHSAAVASRELVATQLAKEEKQKKDAKEKAKKFAESTRRSENEELIEKKEVKEELLDDELVKLDGKQQVITENDVQKELNTMIQEYNNQSKTFDKVEKASNLIKFDKSTLNNDLSSSEIIDRVQHYIIEIANREVSVNDVVNYLICISQGFITTFAGKPGTGKTSLCNILAKSLGLVGNTPSQRRYVDVSVEQGWSSPKDFIGYYNSLTKTMEKSNAEVFDALNLLNSEYEEKEIAPYFILLDEANLSPIEHYWAPFLKNCDFDSTSNRSLSLGGDETWKIPMHLRFFATVNFDNTTEELSPRFLDRSWIITLNPSTMDDACGDCYCFDNIDNMNDIVSFSSLTAAFLPSKEDFIDNAINSKWNIIKAICKNNSFQIMPRNLIMIRNYCLVACKNMSCDTPDTKLIPLDYAFSQKILPLINGTGDDYKNLMDELLKECDEQNMPMSNAHLLRIKNSAENNMGYYQFFSK